MNYEGLFSKKKIKALQYYLKLELISQIMHTHYMDFPFDCCFMTSRIVRELLGLEELGGFVTGLGISKPRRHYDHSWNYDPKKNLDICLTLYQFDKSLPRISVFQKPNSIFHSDKNMTFVQKNEDLSVYGLDKLLYDIQNNTKYT